MDNDNTRRTAGAGQRRRPWPRPFFSRLKIATVFAMVISAALLVPSVAVAAEPPPWLDQIYAALRPENLRTTTGETAFYPGESVEFLFDLVNTSDQPLVIPLTDYYGSSFHLVGVQQGWTERLGPNPTIPGIPPITARKGNWYASGGEIIALEDLPGYTIPAGGLVTRQAGLYLPTAGFPSGTYRFYLEYKTLFGPPVEPVAVIATVSLDVTFGPLVSPVARVNKASFAAGDTLMAGVGLINLGLWQPGAADFYVGTVLPDGNTIAFFTSTGGVAFGTMGNVASFQPVGAGVLLAVPFSVAIPNFLSYQWTGSEPHGDYVFFLLSLKAGALADGTLTGDEILVLATAPFSFP